MLPETSSVADLAGPVTALTVTLVRTLQLVGRIPKKMRLLSLMNKSPSPCLRDFGPSPWVKRCQKPFPRSSCAKLRETHRSMDGDV